MMRNQNQALKTCFFISAVLLLFLFSQPQARAQSAKTYEEAMQKGTGELKKHKLLDAKAYFEMALRLKPGDKTARQLINETVIQIKKQEGRKSGYYALTDQADDYLEKGELDLAKLTYQKALKIVPGDAYAEMKIKEIIQKQNREKQRDSVFYSKIEEGTHLLGLQQFDKAINLFKEARKLFPEREITARKMALALRLKAEYQHRQNLATKEIKIAQRYLLIKNYSEALGHLQKADSLTPGNKNLTAKINQIEPLALKQKWYQEKAQEADRLYMAKNFMAAKKKYQQAEALWPGNPYPGDMINRINTTLKLQKAHLDKNYSLAVHLADSMFRIHELDNAKAQYNLARNLKPNAPYPREQIKKIVMLQKKESAARAAHYERLIREADSLFDKKQFRASGDLFTQALTIRPNSIYPKKKLQEIEQAIVKQAAREKAEARYRELVASGDQFFNSQNWELSLQKFEMASRINPNEVYPKTKIASIQKILADSAKQRKIDEQYARQIQLGNEMKNEKQWEDAKKAYKKALSLKPEAQGPGKAIAAIDSILQQIAHRKKVDLAYRKTFARGDSLLAAKSYQPALKAFQEAATLKPDEAAPRQKIQVVEKVLAAIARQKQLDETYRRTILQADSLLKEKSYELALKDYQTALGLKANASYPKQKIKTINNILLHLEKEREQRYQQTLSQANESFKEKDYQKALSQYEKALSIKPEEAYPRHQIQQCQQQLAATLQASKKQYDQEIAIADKYYHEKAFDQAIDAYRKAHHIMAEDPYPLEMVHKITKYLSDNAIEDVVKQKVTIGSNKTMQFSFKPLPIDVRESNYVLIKATNISGNSFNIIITFGEGKAKNGGFVVQVPQKKGQYDFIIRVGTRYQWFSENNDWFTIFSENNPIQVDLIRISKSD